MLKRRRPKPELGRWLGSDRAATIEELKERETRKSNPKANTSLFNEVAVSESDACPEFGRVAFEERLGAAQRRELSRAKNGAGTAPEHR